MQCCNDDDDLWCGGECHSTMSVIHPVGPMYRPVTADGDKRWFVWFRLVVALLLLLLLLWFVVVILFNCRKSMDTMVPPASPTMMELWWLLRDNGHNAVIRYSVMGWLLYSMGRRCGCCGFVSSGDDDDDDEVMVVPTCDEQDSRRSYSRICRYAVPTTKTFGFQKQHAVGHICGCNKVWGWGGKFLAFQSTTGAALPVLLPLPQCWRSYKTISRSFPPMMTWGKVGCVAKVEIRDGIVLRKSLGVDFDVVVDDLDDDKVVEMVSTTASALRWSALVGNFTRAIVPLVLPQANTRDASFWLVGWIGPIPSGRSFVDVSFDWKTLGIVRKEL